jgi:RNA polymerase sigma-70 factor (ECF subfamily)
MSDFGGRLQKELPHLQRYARSLVRDREQAEDLVQSCLLRALAKQHLWQAGTNLRSWLFTIMHNQHISELRRSWRDRDRMLVPHPVADAAPASASLAVLDLGRAMAELPDEQRRVVLLAGLGEMSYEEVATVLAVPVGTVRSRLARAREKLRKRLELGDNRSLELAA